MIEQKLAQLSQTLHSNHFVLLALKRRLLDLYRVLGEQEEQDQSNMRKRLERQVFLPNDKEINMLTTIGFLRINKRLSQLSYFL